MNFSIFNLQLNKKVIAICGFIIALFVIAYIFYIQLLRPVSSIENARQVEFKIEQGAGAGEIIHNLYNNGLIRSEMTIKIYTFLEGKSFMFKPGVYELNSSQSAKEIIDVLVAGPKAISAVITPGMTLVEIDRYLSEQKIINTRALVDFNLNGIKNSHLFLKNIKSLEGFLFPDTYAFFPSSDVNDVVDKILGNFDEKIGTVGEISELKNIDDFFKKIILASILEKEVIDYKDKQIVAGILEKRILKGMPLQIDATVIYAKCNGAFIGCEIYRSDFKIDSLYNTYKYKGYPPAPISNPGLDSIKAAFNPIKTDYWFYLSDPKTKKTIFAKTLEEQNNNQIKYLR